MTAKLLKIIELCKFSVKFFSSKLPLSVKFYDPKLLLSVKFGIKIVKIFRFDPRSVSLQLNTDN